MTNFIDKHFKKVRYRTPEEIEALLRPTKEEIRRRVRVHKEEMSQGTGFLYQAEEITEWT